MLNTSGFSSPLPLEVQPPVEQTVREEIMGMEVLVREAITGTEVLTAEVQAQEETMGMEVLAPVVRTVLGIMALLRTPVTPGYVLPTFTFGEQKRTD